MEKIKEIDKQIKALIKEKEKLRKRERENTENLLNSYVGRYITFKGEFSVYYIKIEKISLMYAYCSGICITKTRYNISYKSVKKVLTTSIKNPVFISDSELKEALDLSLTSQLDKIL